MILRNFLAVTRHSEANLSNADQKRLLLLFLFLEVPVTSLKRYANFFTVISIYVLSSSRWKCTFLFYFISSLLCFSFMRLRYSFNSTISDTMKWLVIFNDWTDTINSTVWQMQLTNNKWLMNIFKMLQVRYIMRETPKNPQY